MKLYLVDTNVKLVEEWEKQFAEFEGVSVHHGDILELAENTIVSPANSYGYMDGGIDRLYTDYFGMQPQIEIQDAIKKREEGYLPVGASVFVNTGHEKISYMISAPTMISPGEVRPENCFFAMAAVLQASERNKSVVRKVYCPGLATGIGKVSPELAASEMALAYRKWLNVRSVGWVEE